MSIVSIFLIMLLLSFIIAVIIGVCFKEYFLEVFLFGIVISAGIIAILMFVITIKGTPVVSKTKITPLYDTGSEDLFPNSSHYVTLYKMDEDGVISSFKVENPEYVEDDSYYLEKIKTSNELGFLKGSFLCSKTRYVIHFVPKVESSE